MGGNGKHPGIIRSFGSGIWSKASAQIDEEYKGCVITYPSIPIFSGRWTVNVASNNPGLLAKLGGNVVINSHVSLEEAIKEAKRLIDAL